MTSWPNDYGEGYQIYTGSYGGIDDRFKSRRRKRAVGFAPPEQPKPKPRKKR